AAARASRLSLSFCNRPAHRRSSAIWAASTREVFSKSRASVASGRVSDPGGRTPPARRRARRLLRRPLRLALGRLACARERRRRPRGREETAAGQGARADAPRRRAGARDLRRLGPDLAAGEPALCGPRAVPRLLLPRESV